MGGATRSRGNVMKPETIMLGVIDTYVLQVKLWLHSSVCVASLGAMCILAIA